MAETEPKIESLIDRLESELSRMEVQLNAGFYKGMEDVYQDVRVIFQDKLNAEKQWVTDAA